MHSIQTETFASLALCR